MSGSGPVGVALIGAGTISGQYLTQLTTFPDVQVHVVADLNEQLAASRAAEFGVPASGGVEAALSHPDVEIIVNLTIPAAHAAVSAAAVQAGKHVWTEKPFALDRASGQSLLAAAAAAGTRIGCAPDTVLGAGLQTARRMIERGDIGTPLTALTLLQNSGPESWHPNPGFYFSAGGGPLFDMAPYYLSALVQLFGPVRRVAALGSTARPTRVIGSGPLAGTEVPVEVTTHVSAIADFESGQSSQSIFSFDSPLPRAGFVEITGTEATIAVPDPNRFDGEIRLRRRGGDDWESLPAVGAVAGRGVGALDMARAIRAGRPQLLRGEFGYHVLDTMIAITESIAAGAFVDVASSVEDWTAAVPDDWDPTAATL